MGALAHCSDPGSANRAWRCLDDEWDVSGTTRIMTHRMKDGLQPLVGLTHNRKFAST